MQGQAVPVADTQPSLWTETKKSWFCRVLGRSFKESSSCVLLFLWLPREEQAETNSCHTESQHLWLWLSVSVAQSNLIIMFSSLPAALPVCHLWTCHLCRSRTYDRCMPGMTSFPSEGSTGLPRICPCFSVSGDSAPSLPVSTDLPFTPGALQAPGSHCVWLQFDKCQSTWHDNRTWHLLPESLQNGHLVWAQDSWGVHMWAGLIHRQQWHKHIQSTATPRAAGHSHIKARPGCSHTEGRPRLSQDLPVMWGKHSLRQLQVLFHSLLFQNIKILWKVCWNKNQITDSGIY